MTDPGWDPWARREPRHGEPYTHAPATPDWAALADAAAARNRRRKLLGIGGAALAIVGIGAAVAYAIVSADRPAGSSDARPPAAELPAGGEPPGGPTTAAPSFSSVAPPVLPDPQEFIDSAAKDTAPLRVEALFPGRTLTMAGIVYRKGPLDQDRSCAKGVQPAMAGVLDANGCRQLLRATYTRDGAAVTVAVAVFDTRAQAAKVKAAKPAGSSVLPLTGSGVAAFCRATVCRNTANSTGRYAYFTLGGHLDGDPVTKADKDVFRIGDDLAEFAFRQIQRRGEAQASAAVNSP
ncbi:hypothetical protein [Streptomyces sp. NPDC060194]|uniref:hypothetical protein n=1 Tax=Streptomyces sp. NPDC060194 TaxID=3347069 RepID=UPI0036477CB5